MRIIKEGNLSKIKKADRFECDKCGCIFECDIDDCCTRVDYQEDAAYHDCPACGNSVYLKERND